MFFKIVAENKYFLMDSSFIFIVELAENGTFFVIKKFYLGEIGLDRIENSLKLEFIVKGGSNTIYEVDCIETIKDMFKLYVMNKGIMQDLEIIQVSSFFLDCAKEWEKEVTDLV